MPFLSGGFFNPRFKILQVALLIRVSCFTTSFLFQEGGSTAHEENQPCLRPQVIRLVSCEGGIFPQEMEPSESEECVIYPEQDDLPPADISRSERNLFLCLDFFIYLLDLKATHDQNDSDWLGFKTEKQ